MQFLRSPLLQISALSGLDLCPRLKLVNTTHANDELCTSRRRPDISIYSELKDIPEDTQSKRYLDWKMIDLWMEDKNQNEDIFYMLADLQRDEKAGDLESHIRWMNLAYKNCGQLIAYATELHHSQLHSFLVPPVDCFGGIVAAWYTPSHSCGQVPQINPTKITHHFLNSSGG